MTNRPPQSDRFAGLDEPIPGYRLVDRLGRGGYGEVWKVLAPGGVSKAIKLVFGDDPSRTAVELRALNRIKDVRHPFLLSIERIEQLPGLLAIVTELGDCNLQEHFQTCRANGLPGVPQEDLLGMLRDVADVLDHIYQEHALQHLDIKPANLLLFGKRLKVADFGLVKNIYERSASLVHGLTPTYAAPEIFEGQPTRASDQYSLGILYQEMLTGVLPFDGTSAARLAAQHLRDTPDLRALPTNQQPIIARALSKDPQQRFPTCVALVDELMAAVRRGSTNDPHAREESPLGRDLLRKSKVAAAEPKSGPQQRLGDLTASQLTSDTQNKQSGEARHETTTRPTIVVGIGGSAARVLQRLRLRILDRIGSIESVPAFKMLLVDVDPETLNEVNRDQRAWSALETIPTPLRSSAEYREQGHLHRRWLSRRWLFNVPRNLRTDGLRPLGRLALVSNSSRVMSALRSAILSVTSRLPEGSEALPPRILLVSSISGGTGSGMVLDLAYAARAEMNNAGWADGVVDGLLLHSTPVGAGKDKALLNAIATLRELNHYSTAGNFYPGEQLLPVPPFHGNNQTFSSTQLVHFGEDLDTSEWLRAVDNVAEYVYCKLLTPLDRHAEHVETGHTSRPIPTLDVVQIRQIGGYSGSFVDDLTRQLGVDVVDGWCGFRTPSVSGGHTQSAASLLLNVMEDSKSSKYQQLAGEAETHAATCGADVQRLMDRAREVLEQELGMTPRKYLQSLFQEAISVADHSEKPDHELAELVIALQDRAIGLDFGERPTDSSRNTLFDLLHSRLASQAMQIAARFTDWIYDLVDRPDAGVDAARHAAEAGRNCIRDLVGALGQEMQAMQKVQTVSRMDLTTPLLAGKAPKSAGLWLLQRGNGRKALEEKLAEHGNTGFEELLMVCVRWQLRAIEAHSTAAIDHLLGLWQELKQLSKQLGIADSLVAAADGGPATGYEQSLRKLLLDHRPRLVKELRRRIERDVLTGPKKLQRFLQQRGSFDQALGEPLRRHARQVVLESMQQVLLILLQQDAASLGEESLDIDATLSNILQEPMALTGDWPQRAMFVVPEEVAATSLQRRLHGEATNVTVMPARTNIIAICRESQCVPITDVIDDVAHGQHSLLSVAENLHARTDVVWHPAEFGTGNPLDSNLVGTEVAATVRLT